MLLKLLVRLRIFQDFQDLDPGPLWDLGPPNTKDDPAKRYGFELDNKNCQSTDGILDQKGEKTSHLA